MHFICDNSYFLEGMKEYINPGKFIISGMQTDNVVIISSSRISEIVGFLYKNNISDTNTLYFSSPEALRFLWGVVDSPVYDTTYTDTSWNKSGEVSDISALHYPGYDNNFAWSFGAGVRYDVTPDIALDLSYRYLDAGDASVSYKDEWGDKYKSEVDVKSHDIMLGVTYNF